MLMSEFNKLIIFGKYNGPNYDFLTIVDLTIAKIINIFKNINNI